MEHGYATSGLYQRKQRSVAHFLRADGVQGAEMHIHLCAQDGDNAVPQRLYAGG